MKKLILAAALSASALVAAPAMAQTVTNGSLESPVVSPGNINYGQAAPGVTLNGGATIERNGGQFGYAAAPAGFQIGTLQNGGSIAFGVDNLSIGQSYVVNFLTAQRPGYAVATINVDFGGSLGTFTPTSTGFAAATPFRFTASGTSGTLTFTGLGAPGVDVNAGIDAITVSVPEPATWAMMLLGFAMVGFGLRRRARTTDVAFA